MDSELYNVNIRGLNCIINVVCENTRIICIFTTASNKTPVIIISFILTKPKNENHTRKWVRVDENGALENSTDVTNIFVYELIKDMETTGGYA